MGKENSAEKATNQGASSPTCPAALLPSSPSPLPLSAAGGQCPESSAFDCKGEERLMYYKVEVERKKIQFLKEQ